MFEFSDGKALNAVVPWVGGAIGGALLMLLKNRRALVTYTVSHQRIGMTAEDDVHGRVEVRYRDNVVQNLYLSVVEIRNASIKDLENLNIKTCRGNDNMALLTEQSRIHDTLEFVPFTNEYLNRISSDAEWERNTREADGADTPENAARIKADLNFRHGQRHYGIPVFNRGQTATITYLVSAAGDTSPVIQLVCQTPGVRVKERKDVAPVTRIMGIPLVEAAWAGFIVSAAAIAFLVWIWELNAFASTVIFVIAMSAGVSGALVVRGGSWLREKLVG